MFARNNFGIKGFIEFSGHHWVWLSLCRGIMIDLKEMFREEDIPPTIQPKRVVLM
jgi:hypothetical protein